MRKARKKESQSLGTRINEAIRSREVRVIDPEEGNLGVMTRDEAIARAQEKGLDLIEISGDTTPAIVKIMDYGRYQYEHKRKQRDIRAKVKEARVEVKEIQIKPGTGEHDLKMKANRATQWLKDGQRVKVELFLRGRSKYMSDEFLHGKLDVVLTHITTPYTMVEEIKKVPKGLSLIIEQDKKAAFAQAKENNESSLDTQDTSDTISDDVAILTSEE